MYDLKIFYFFNNLAGKSAVFDWFAIFAAEYLEWFVIAAFLAFLYFSVFSRPEKWRIFWMTAISVVLSRFVITELIRFFYCRPRPFITYAVNQLAEDANCSFPSGHAAFFFSLAMAIYFYPIREPKASNGASNKKWGLWFFTAALIMGIARVVVGVHYPLDILAGAIVGILSAYAVFYFVKKQPRL